MYKHNIIIMKSQPPLFQNLIQYIKYCDITPLDYQIMEIPPYTLLLILQ